VGYFLDLLRFVVGGAKAPDAAKMDQGWPGVLVVPVYGENEEANPWKEPWHVGKGFKPTDNVVTVGSSTPQGAIFWPPFFAVAGLHLLASRGSDN
jgi:hypothetical protein